jgi:hypothetical protein
MALTCQLSINTPSYAAGNTPPPALSLLVVNGNAVAVAVTGVELQFMDQLGNAQRPPVNPPIFPFGPGMGTTVAALSSQTFGPMALPVWMAGNVDTFIMVQPGSQPTVTQGSLPPQREVYVGALVYASDGSVNVAGRAKLLVSYNPAPPRGYQGGNADFAGANNAALIQAVL